MVSFQIEATLVTSIEPNFLTVSALYDFSASGPGTFTFSPVSNFQVIEPDGTTHIETTDARSVAVTIAAVSRHEPGLEKREMIGCADWKNGFTIRLSVLEARFMANVTALYIKKWGSNDQLYKDYFGSSPVDDVVSKFTSIVDGKTASGVLECSDGPLKICRDTSNPAYNHDQNIYFCRSFYAQLPLLSLCEGDPAVNEHNIRSATMLHYLLKALDPSMKNFQMTCASHVEIGFPNRANVLGNYVVSTQTPRIPRTRGLTWGHDLCSASLARLWSTPSARYPGSENIGGSNVVFVWVVVLSLCLKPDFESFVSVESAKRRTVQAFRPQV